MNERYRLRNWYSSERVVDERQRCPKLQIVSLHARKNTRGTHHASETHRVLERRKKKGETILGCDDRQIP